ncbi:MAG: molecular chaperone HtpG, partial [Clostridia bacterium]|nr:molecular chaperone HtpG [Clostridia bacterium]
LNFRGILYFPKIGNEYESLEGQVKLFYNQVFVADNIKEVVPEYLLMLKGVLDCPELPLNVSRSYLQNNAYVSKISSHIVKKVSDKLSGMFRNDRENYEKIWRDIKTFVEYGAMRDPSFYDKIKDVVLYEKCEGGFATLPEILEASGEKGKDRIYYATDKAMQAKYISMYKAEGIQVILLDRLIDTQFVSSVEAKETDRKVKFLRVDAEVSDALSEGKAEKNEDLEKVFKPLVPEKTEIGFAQFKDSSVPAILTLSEEDRRFEDMMKLYAFSGGEKDNSFAAGQKLVLNTGNPLIGKIAEKAGSEPELATALARQIYLLTVLSQRPLSEEEMTGLLETSYGLLEKLS